VFPVVLPTANIYGWRLANNIGPVFMLDLAPWQSMYAASGSNPTNLVFHFSLLASNSLPGCNLYCNVYCVTNQSPAYSYVPSATIVTTFAGSSAGVTNVATFTSTNTIPASILSGATHCNVGFQFVSSPSTNAAYILSDTYISNQ